jgi:hypothetical protein
MAPTPKDITVALDALRADADRWAAAAMELHDAAAEANARAIDPAAFSFAGHAAAVAYEALRVKMAGLIDQGARNLDSVAAALRASADAYEADETAGVHRMQNIY